MDLNTKRIEIITQIKKRNLLYERSLKKWFGKIPRNVRLLINDFHFDEKKVLDIGCSYGSSLLYWGSGSAGVEIQEKQLAFLGKMGVKTYALNVENGFQQIDEKFEAIYSNNLIEHLVAPHLFLIRLWRLLQPNGILLIGYPVAPMNPFAKFYRLIGRSGWLALEHINFIP